MELVITPLIQALGAVLAAALTALVVQAFRKLGLSLDADRQAQVEYYAKQAVLKVEEEAAAYAKSHMKKIDPGIKMRRAVVALIAKVPRINTDEAGEILEAVLPQVGIGAAAGARRLGEALRTK